MTNCTKVKPSVIALTRPDHAFRAYFTIMHAVASVAGPPTDVQAFFSTATDMTLTWTPPVNTGLYHARDRPKAFKMLTPSPCTDACFCHSGGIPLLSYQIVLRMAADGTGVHNNNVGPEVTSITYTDLQPSTSYTVEVLAQNEKGWSSPQQFEFRTASTRDLA